MGPLKPENFRSWPTPKVPAKIPERLGQMTEFNTADLRVKSLRGPSAKGMVILWKQRENE